MIFGCLGIGTAVEILASVHGRTWRLGRQHPVSTRYRPVFGRSCRRPCSCLGTDGSNIHGCTWPHLVLDACTVIGRSWRCSRGAGLGISKVHIEEVPALGIEADEDSDNATAGERRHPVVEQNDLRHQEEQHVSADRTLASPKGTEVQLTEVEEQCGLVDTGSVRRSIKFMLRA